MYCGITVKQLFKSTLKFRYVCSIFLIYYVQFGCRKGVKALNFALKVHKIDAFNFKMSVHAHVFWQVKGGITSSFGRHSQTVSTAYL